MIFRFRTVARPKLCYLTVEQLAEVAANLVLEFGSDVKLVSFSTVPPADTSVPWQPVDACGGNPLGQIRTFQNGEWK